MQWQNVSASKDDFLRVGGQDDAASLEDAQDGTGAEGEQRPRAAASSIDALRECGHVDPGQKRGSPARRRA
eukprot:15459110-Alexandrium_andersonii.AAC.1